MAHPSFFYLHKLFLYLFSKIYVTNFHCDSYVLVKHHRTSFPSSSNKSLVFFSISYSDVWGHLVLLIIQILNGLFLSLMIIIVFHEPIYWKKKVMFFPYLSLFIKWFLPSLIVNQVQFLGVISFKKGIQMLPSTFKKDVCFHGCYFCWKIRVSICREI